MSTDSVSSASSLRMSSERQSDGLLGSPESSVCHSGNAWAACLSTASSKPPINFFDSSFFSRNFRVCSLHATCLFCSLELDLVLRTTPTIRWPSASDQLPASCHGQSRGIWQLVTAQCFSWNKGELVWPHSKGRKRALCR